jgi:hypothetical protein
MRRTILISVTITIVLLFSGYFYVRNMPHYSLYLLKGAIENHEPDEALKYINIDSIVDNLGRDFLGKDGGGNIQESGKNPSMKRMVTDALPGIKESIRSSFRAAIASHGDNKQKKDLGTVGSNHVVNDKLNKSIIQEVPRGKTSDRPHKNPLFSIGGIEIANLDVRKIKKISLWDLVIRVDGKTAIVHVKDTPNIKAKMVKTDGGYWQVMEILLSPNMG